MARTDDFQRLCHDVAMHIAAVDPRFLKREEVTPEILERERDIYKAQARATGKPDNVIDKIVNGKMEKFYEENCLYEQHFIRDEGITVKELVDAAIAKLGENVAIRRFARFKVGETDGAQAGTPARRRRLRRPKHLRNNRASQNENLRTAGLPAGATKAGMHSWRPHLAGVVLRRTTEIKIAGRMPALRLHACRLIIIKGCRTA